MPATLAETIADPRVAPSSPDAAYQPACDGHPWPEADTADAIERQQIEFLAVYTRLNELHDRHREIQARGGNPEEERLLLAGLNRIIQHRDQLEDRYAPVGFYAEPEMQEHLAVNLVFHYAQKHVRENHRRNEPVEAWMKVPLPDKETREQLASVPGIPINTVLADLQRIVGGSDPAAKTKIS